MNRKRFLWLFALPLFGAAGCSKEAPADRQDGPDPIRFEIAFDTPLVTRMATDLSKSTWEDGDSIGVYIVPHGSFSLSDPYPRNVKMTYNATDKEWEPEEDFYWPRPGNSTQTFDFYAYFPYSEDAENPWSIRFDVSLDQSIPANFQKSNLLTAKSDKSGAGYAKKDTVKLSFSHARSMIQVTVVSPDEEVKAVQLTGVKTRSNLNLGKSGGPAADTLANDIRQAITMFPFGTAPSGHYIFWALVPAQKLAAGSRLFRIVTDDGTIFQSEGLPPEGLTLQPGTAETFEQTLTSTP